MKYRVTHVTEYSYAEQVTQCFNEAHLAPRDAPHQHCLSNHLSIDPLPADHTQREDFFGNRVDYFSIEQPHTRFALTATSEIQLDSDLLESAATNATTWNEVRDRLHSPDEPALVEQRQFILDSPLIPAMSELADYATASFSLGRPLMQAVHELMERIHQEFRYDPGFTRISTPLSAVLHHRRGVCQDFAHLAIGCLRAMGLAARYVSGYLETTPPPGKERVLGADASHAWFSVFLPESGWIDFDPTNNQMPLQQHITTAWGRDFSDVTPMKGVIFGGGSEHELKVSVDVERLAS
jgi:transglutaminase-like putative cysteine protease